MRTLLIKILSCNFIVNSNNFNIRILEITKRELAWPVSSLLICV